MAGRQEFIYIKKPSKKTMEILEGMQETKSERAKRYLEENYEQGEN